MMNLRYLRILGLKFGTRVWNFFEVDFEDNSVIYLAYHLFKKILSFLCLWNLRSPSRLDFTTGRLKLKIMQEKYIKDL